MTDVRQLALGTVLAGFEGRVAPRWLRGKLAEGLGGAVLFGRNVQDDEQVTRLVDSIHAEAPAVVAIDEEGGDVTRLDLHIGSAFPGNYALGRAGDPALTQDVAAELGGRLADLGVDLDLAPVADLLLDPMSPIVGVRSFGADPPLVARQVAAFVAGLQSQGVAACLKHFPGHGATAGDSHRELPALQGGAAGLEAALIPFAAGIDAGARAVMTAHVRVPSIDMLPATLSAPVIGGLLRGRLGFDGVVVTDGLDMGAIADSRSAGPLALVAGVDALCLGGGPLAEADVDQAVEAIVHAVAEGRLSIDRLAEAAARVRALASWAAAGRESRVPRRGGAAVEAARRALRSVGRVQLSSPVTMYQFAVEPSAAAGPVPLALGNALREAGLSVTVVDLELRSAPSLDPSPASRGRDGAGFGSLLVVVRDLHRWPWQQRVLADLTAVRPDAVVVEVGLDLLQPECGGYLATGGASRVSCEAAADVLAGVGVAR
jgi:beta-N-acetylhexosaminidase